MFLVVTCCSEERHTQWILVFNIYISITVTDNVFQNHVYAFSYQDQGTTEYVFQ